MKRAVLFLTLLFSVVLLVSCGDNRVEPTLEVPLELNVRVGVRVDVTKDVVAKDQDGTDLKSAIVVTTESSEEDILIDGKFITVNNVGSYIISLTVTDPKDAKLSVTKTIFVDAISNDEVVEGEKTTYLFDKVSEEALNGFKVLEGENEGSLTVENGALIYLNGKTNAKLTKDLVLNSGASYQIELEVKASKVLNDVTLSIDELAINQTFTINEEYKSISINVSPEADIEVATLILDLKDNSDYTLFVERLFIQTSSGLEVSKLDLEKFEYYNDNGESTKTVIDDKIIIDITNPEAGIWEQKLIKNEIQLQPNKKYILTYTIKANQNIRYEFIARVLDQQAGDRDENYIWSAPTANQNEEKIVRHVFETNEHDINDFEMFFQIGGQENPTKIEIYDINLNYYNTFEEETTRFTGVATFESFEGDDASASLYIDLNEKALVYDVTKFGTVDWHNKVFIDEVMFKEDSRYRVTFTMKASKDIELFFAVNPMGQWEPRVTDVIEVTTEYVTFEYETDNFQTFNQNFELLFQFGSFNEGSAQIYFKDLEITQLVRK